MVRRAHDQGLPLHVKEVIISLAQAVTCKSSSRSRASQIQSLTADLFNFTIENDLPLSQRTSPIHLHAEQRGIMGMDGQKRNISSLAVWAECWCFLHQNLLDKLVSVQHLRKWKKKNQKRLRRKRGLFFHFRVDASICALKCWTETEPMWPIIFQPVIIDLEATAAANQSSPEII